ncbi:MAG: response regulator transcription factor [Candidatus Levybacteria bacterium]|nr:response regulator transcription factor [Candidatus Levybacteria bacterium]
MKLLLIEDDFEIAITLKEELEKNYIVKISATGEDGEYQAEINDYDLILLDLGLPDKDGLEVCRNIRKSGVRAPILVLTGQADLKMKVSLLDAGADDYLTKPFKLEELMARVRALLRRPKETLLSNTLSTSDLTLDLDKKTAKRETQLIALRKKEFYLLEYLVRNAGNVVSRGMILDNVWDNDCDSLTNIVDVHINYLRDRIDKPYDKKLIKTVHGLGYKIEA